MVGELALTGAVRPVKGVLPIALSARAQGKAGIFVPPEKAAEAAVVSGLQVIPIQNLREAVSFLEGEIQISPTRVDIEQIFAQNNDDEIDFSEVKGQESVKRALEIAAAGGHNALTLFTLLPRINRVENAATFLGAILVKSESSRNIFGKASISVPWFLNQIPRYETDCLRSRGPDGPVRELQSAH